MTSKTVSTRAHKRPGSIKAHLAMFAFVVVAMISLSLTSVGLYHTVAGTAATTAATTTTAIVTQSSLTQVIGAVR